MDLEKAIFKDCFNFLQNNFPPTVDQQYWADLVRQQTEIEKRFKGEKFAVDMLLACTRRICEIYDSQIR